MSRQAALLWAASTPTRLTHLDSCEPGFSNGGRRLLAGPPLPRDQSLIDIGLRHGSRSVSLSTSSCGYVGHAHGGDAPDLLGVLPYRAVARELAHPCRVHDRLLSP